jgi:hypothetical protein
MYVRWLDEIKDFRFDVTHLPAVPGTRNPTDPLSRRGFADGDGPAASTGDTDAESQQELFLRLGRDAPAQSRLAAVCGASAPVGRRPDARQLLSSPTSRGGRNQPPAAQGGGGGGSLPSISLYVRPAGTAGSELTLRTGTTAPSQPAPSDDQFLSPTFVQLLAAELTTGPIVRGAAAADNDLRAHCQRR